MTIHLQISRERATTEPSKPEVKPQTAKELLNTGDAGMLTGMLGGLFAGTGFLGVKPHHPNCVWMVLLSSGSAVSASSQ